MYSRFGSDLTRAVNVSAAARDESGVRCIRRVRAAFVVGAGVTALAALVFGSGIAVAGRSGGGDSPLSFITSQSPGSGPADQPADPAQPRSNVSSAKPARSLSSRAVCVRLCDGSFFPLSGVDAQGTEAACASQCPGAPSQVFFMASGSDKIEDAVARDGQRYTALPVAFRYRSTLDNTCTCGAKDGRDNLTALLQDPTLRKGDLIMTAAGVRVFQGARALPHEANDFIDPAQSSLPREERATLTAIDQVNARAPATVARDAPQARASKNAAVRAHPSVVVSSTAAQ
jgi:hypothetical protein